MPVADSSLYIACNAMGDFIRSGLQTNVNDIDVYIGSPSEIVSRRDENRINLFFYRFEPSGFQANIHPNEPWRIRLHCMITTMAEEEIADHPGEDDLRMLGSVMELFHETRLLPSFTVNDQAVHFQAIFQASSDEQLNQIWSILGEATYRPSALYELSLTPIMPSQLRGEAPKVGELGLETRVNMQRQLDPFAGIIRSSTKTPVQIDSNFSAWVPSICWVENNECIIHIDIDVETTPPNTVTPQIWVAGAIGETVTLVWQIWQGDEWETQTDIDLVISSTEINTNNIPITLPTINLPPLLVDADHDRWQLILNVTRQFQTNADSPTIELSSNSILISLYRGSLL